MKKLKLTNNKVTGMTLIELIITVAIIGILAGIAYPLYNDQARKKSRGIAIASLLQARAELEKCFLNSTTNDYSTCNLTAYNSAANTSNIDKSNLFNIAVVFSANNDTYTLTANNANAQVDPDCGNLTISNIGAKSISGTAPVQRCWAQ